MSYRFDQPLQFVKGVGPVLAKKFAEQEIATVKDLLLFVPLRYEDRSLRKTIGELEVDELVTVLAAVTSTSNYYKGPRSIQSASVKDDTGRLKLMWFNNKFIIDKLEKGQSYLISGRLNERGVMVQPTVENAAGESIHTDRLVPIYSSTLAMKQGSLRRLLKHILDNLEEVADPLASPASFNQVFNQLHFPDLAEKVVEARERLALDELLLLIDHSHRIKAKWQQLSGTARIIVPQGKALIPGSVPFVLTAAQLQATQEIMADLKLSTPMNRLLVGDVGSGKTVVAGVASLHTLAAGHHSALIAPTQILAEQHAQTFAQLFPQLPTRLVTAKSKTSLDDLGGPTLFIGTHALINRLNRIVPSLIIYDEQHRFGVNQRSAPAPNGRPAHILTMSATPIPRSLMLTIFAHLKLSLIDELPPGRLPVKTWVVTERKKEAAYRWVIKQVTHGQKSQSDRRLALVVCPFIKDSVVPAFSQVAAATSKFKELQTISPTTRIELLHGQLPVTQKQSVIKNLFNQQTQVLVTTPVIEVGLDAPHADVVVIESAERFGLASLHQLRGRVGRAGQQAYCLVMPSSDRQNLHRLQQFAAQNNGQKLAEQDLKRRGAGDLFGTEQSGFDQLRFATWTNLQLITRARQTYSLIQAGQIHWQPLFKPLSLPEDSDPLAN